MEGIRGNNWGLNPVNFIYLIIFNKKPAGCDRDVLKFSGL